MLNVIIPHDHTCIPYMLSIREYMIGNEGIEFNNIILTSEILGEKDLLNNLYDFSYRTFDDAIAISLNTGQGINVICSDNHLLGGELHALRENIIKALQLGVNITLSLTVDGSSNRNSVHNESDLLSFNGVLKNKINAGNYFNMGFAHANTLSKRASFKHIVVKWSLIGSYVIGSGLKSKGPYTEITDYICTNAKNKSNVVWIPLRAICADEKYCDGIYNFGRNEPGVNILNVYKNVFNALKNKYSKLTNATIIVLADYRVESLFDGSAESLIRSTFGSNAIYIKQSKEIRFDFILSMFANQSIKSHNYIICGDSTTSIPISSQEISASFVLGYRCRDLLELGAEEWQIKSICNRIHEWVIDTIKESSGSLKNGFCGISAVRIEDFLYLIQKNNIDRRSTF